MKTVSIIGLGWIGEPLGFYLKEKGYSVKGSTTSAEKHERLKAKGMDVIRLAFIPHPEGIGFNSLFQSEIVIITIPPRTRSGDGGFYLEQLKFLKSILDRSQVKKVLFVSSTGIYPDVEADVPYAEDFPTSLENSGNTTLFQAEQSMASNREYELTIVRLGGLMGADRVAGKYFSGKENVAGHTRVNFIHQIDSVRLLTWIIEKGLWNDTFNGVAPIHPLRKEIYEKNSIDLGIAPPKSYQNEPEGKDRLISSEKILKTGFEFKFPDPLKFLYF